MNTNAKKNVSKVIFWTLKKMMVCRLLFFCFMLSLGSIQAGLVSSWYFEEGTGSTVADASGNGHTVTLAGGSWVDGKIGSALEFDGSDDQATISNPSGLTSSTGSIEFWMKVDSVHLGGIFHLFEGYTTDFIRTAVNTNGRLDLVIEDNNETKIYVYYDLDNLYGAYKYVGKWLHIVWVQDGTEVKLYINGERKVLSGTNSGDWWSEHLNANSASIGAAWGYFDGTLDEIRIYDNALSESAIANNALGKYTAAGWHFNEGTGSTVADFSGSGHTVTLNGPSWTNGKIGSALEFDGSDDQATISNPSGLTSSTGSIEFWMKVDSVHLGGIFHLFEGYTTDFIRTAVNANGRLDLVIEDNNELKIYVYYDLDDLWYDYVDEWLHVIWTQDGTEVKLYINGERKMLSGTNSGDWWSDHLDANSASIGAAWGYFDGLIDEMSIINRPLTAEAVCDVIDSSGLCGRWEMNEATGTNVFDNSGNGNDATFVNMAALPWVKGVLNSNGYFEKSLCFNNSGDYLSINNSSSLQITDDLTISLWIKPTTVGVKQCSLVDKDFGGEFSLILGQDGAVKLRQGKSQSSGQYFEATVIPSNSIVNNHWQYIVVTRNMATREIKGYLDCVLKNTVTYPDDPAYSPPATTTSAVIIGSGYFSDYNGDIDKVKLYSMVLEQETIEREYLLNAYSGHSYYTTEDGIAVCTLDIPVSDGLNNSSLVVKNSQGTTLATNSSPTNATDLTFSTASLSTGENTISVELQRSTGEIVFHRDVEVIKLTANAGCEVKTDLKNGILLRDGDAFFPISLYMYDVTSSETAVFQEVADAGFNNIIRWYPVYGVTPSDAGTYLENADTYGLSVIDWMSVYSTINLSNSDVKYTTEENFWNAYKGLSPFSVDQSSRMIQAVGYAKQETNLIGYYTFDEPYFTQIEAGQDLYTRTNNEDGYHPTIASVTESKLGDIDYTSWWDVLIRGTYFHPPRVSGDLSSSVDVVSKSINLYSALAKKHRKVFWALLMGEFSSDSYKRVITPEEQYCQTYLALIGGAKGVFYFRYPIYHNDSWNTLDDLASELTMLAPSMLTPDLVQSITYSSGICDPINNKFVDVQVSLRKAPAGASYDYVLLAVNTQNYSVDVDYAISLLGSSGTISRMFDTNTYTVTNGKFSDTLLPLATRAYTFVSSSTDPITIDVDITPGTNSNPESAPYPYSGRPGMTNIMQNPSLEDNTITNWPDYCKPWDATPRINTQNQGWGLVDTPDLSELCDEIDNDGGDSDGDGNPGSKCLKINRNNQLNGVYFRLTPSHTDTNGKDYTFSVYMKADQSGRQVKLSSLLGNTTVTLSTSWARYSLTINVPANWGAENNFSVKLIDDNSTVWVDAIQVEEGSTATTFTVN